MKKTLISLTSVIAMAGASQAQVLSEDFSNYTSTSNSAYNSELGEARLHELGSIVNWTHTNKVGILQHKADKGGLFLYGGSPSGNNAAVTKLTILADGVYTVSFDSYTIKDSGKTGVADVFIKGAGWLETFKEESDGASTARSYNVKLSKGDYTFGFQHRAEGDEQDVIIDNVKISAVPEPSSTMLLGLGAFGLLARRKR